MNPLRYVFVVILGSVFLLTFSGTADLNAAVDRGIYAELLNKYAKDGVVDYAGFKTDEGKLDAYLKVLEGIDPEALPRNEQFAFYINAYNAWTIKLVLSGYPGINSIKDLGGLFTSPWKKKICRINGKVITLDDIEHGILRPRFKDPRIHFAINCASKGCPPLLSEPFRGAVLDRQLDRVTRDFLNDPERNRLDGNTLYVSRIFKWFKEDFKDDIVGFFLKYAEGALKERSKAGTDAVDIEYLDYDWTLNGK